MHSRVPPSGSEAATPSAAPPTDRLVARGGCNYDGVTGDGSGLMTQIPWQLLQKWADQENLGKINPGQSAVGMFFLKPEEQEEARRRRKRPEETKTNKKKTEHAGRNKKKTEETRRNKKKTKEIRRNQKK